MMLEDTLTYNPPHDRTFAALLTAELENDGLEFFLRMSGDIGTVARETNRPTAGDDLADLLLTALVAAPAGRTAAWQQLYRGVRTLVAGFAPVPSAGARPDLSSAFRRLRQFVRENADLADTLALVNLERAAYCRAAGA
ncbi:MAG TPA: hypothetical protein VGP41_01475 [Candidatus Lustribacter sp.]|jgi:hypothetical protein|nr:hypothetical protein [Candidatus Lustribacter sp.]